MRLFNIFKRRVPPIPKAHVQDKQLSNVISAVVYSDRILRKKTNYFIYLDGTISKLNEQVNKDGNLLIGLQSSLETLWHPCTQTIQLMKLIKELSEQRNLKFITPADRFIKTDLKVLHRKYPGIKGLQYLECRNK